MKTWCDIEIIDDDGKTSAYMVVENKIEADILIKKMKKAILLLQDYINTQNKNKMLAENKQLNDLPIDAQNTWASLGDVPTNNNDEIEQDFLHFPKGTERWDIYLWFEEKYKCIVGNIL